MTAAKYHLGYSDEKDVFIDYQRDNRFARITAYDGSIGDGPNDSIQLSEEMRWQLLQVLLAHELPAEALNAVLATLEVYLQREDLRELMTQIVAEKQS